MRIRCWLRWIKTDVLWRLRLPMLLVVFGGSLAAAAYAGITVVWPAIVAHPYFKLQSVKVICDSPAVEPVVLASRAGLYDGTSLWEIDADKAEHSLEEAIWVRDARIERRFPDEVRLEVFRREAVAATLGPDGPYLIDAGGVVFREEGGPRYPDLPYVTGWGRSSSRAERIETLRLSIDLLTAFSGAGESHVSQIDIDSGGVYWLYLQGRQLPVRLGRDPVPDRVAHRLESLLEVLPTATADIREVDLSYHDRAVVRVAEGRMGRVLSTLASNRSDRAAGGNDRG